MDVALALPAGNRQPAVQRADDAPAHHMKVLIERTVAAAFEVEPDLIRLPTRGHKRISLARQVAMYLAHVSCEMSFTEIGHAFARDRSTVAHACATVEQKRDDPEFDRALDLLENIVALLDGLADAKR